MAVRVTSSGPRGAKTYEIRWKDGELYDYTDSAAAAKRMAAAARKAERAYYGSGRRKNPTKAQKKERTRKASAKRRVATALAGWLKKMNPGSKIVGAELTRLKGGVIKVKPIKANAGRSIPGRGMKDFKTGAAAQSFVRKLEKAGLRPSVGFEDYRPAGRLSGAKKRRYTVRW